MATKRELIDAIAGRYQEAGRPEKKLILDEFIQVTGFHRKHAIRALRQNKPQPSAAAPRSRIYDEAVVKALTILWERRIGSVGSDSSRRFRSWWRRWSDMNTSIWTRRCVAVFLTWTRKCAAVFS